MKKMIYRALSLLLVILLHACEYKDIYDAGSEYPVDKVYIAGTYESIIYKVDQIVETENAPFRYKIDVENNKVLIPLGIYRSSVWSNNDVSVELGIDNDTIPALIDSEELVGEDGTIPEILPADKYRLDTEIHIAKGEDLGQLNLTVDIPFLLDNLDKAIADSNDVDARSTLMTISALTVNGLTTLGKAGDWVLYPLNTIVMDYCNVAYKPCITVIFPYWIKMIYDGQEEINSYFNKAFDVVIEGREKKDILKDGLKAIFKLYRKYNLPINYSEIHEVKENSEALQESLEMLAGMQSIYTELTTEKVMQMINEAIHGI